MIGLLSIKVMVSKDEINVSGYAVSALRFDGRRMKNSRIRRL